MVLSRGPEKAGVLRAAMRGDHAVLLVSRSLKIDGSVRWGAEHATFGS
jgi:hypothetical protein